MREFLACWAGYLVAGLFLVVLLAMTGVSVETVGIVLRFLTCTLLLALVTKVLLKQCAMEKRMNEWETKEQIKGEQDA